MPAIKFRGVDFIEFDTLLNDDERLVRDTARKFIEDNLIPIIEECNRDGRFPRELVKPMAELGFFGASLKGYGCAGMSNVEYGLVTQELERGDSRRALVRQRAVGAGDVSHLRLRQRGAETEWLPAMQKGEKLGCFGLTEPDFGSNPGGMRTRARKVGQRIRPQRREDVDHLRLHRRRRRHLGEGGGRRRHRSAASSSKPIAPASKPTTSTASGRCAPRSPPAFRCRTSTFPQSNLLPKSAA